MPHRFVLLFPLLLVFMNTSFAQERWVIKNAELGLAAHASASDSIIQSLIKVANDSLTIDSIKVEIVHFLGKTACDACLNYLVEHINDRFSYGNGISDIDQDNLEACFYALVIIADDPIKKWDLLTPIFNALRYKQRQEFFILKLSRILHYISDKSIAKAIIGYELKKSERVPQNHLYKNNLILMLKAIE